MVVLFILITMAALAVTAVRGTQKQAQRRTAFTYVKTLERAVDLYALDIGQPPTSQQGLGALISPPDDLPNPDAWGGPYIKDTATSKDPWGNNYQYASPGREGREFEIWSFGPDRIDGTLDDIGTWLSSI